VSTSSGSGALPVGPTRAARPLANPKPAYPSASIRLREEGEVLCRLTIDAGGGVVDVAVARSSGHTRLDAAAVHAVRRWRFEPALRDGVAEATTATLPVVFRLHDAR
jgi:TonB family protein